MTDLATVAVMTPAPAPQPPPVVVAEGSLRARFVTLLTPLFTIAAGYLAALGARYLPGLQLDPGQVAAFMVAASTSALTAALKWLHGWQQHERLVAEGRDLARKPLPVPPR